MATTLSGVEREGCRVSIRKRVADESPRPATIAVRNDLFLWESHREIATVSMDRESRLWRRFTSATSCRNPLDSKSARAWGNDLGHWSRSRPRDCGGLHPARATLRGRIRCRSCSRIWRPSEKRALQGADKHEHSPHSEGKGARVSTGTARSRAHLAKPQNEEGNGEEQNERGGYGVSGGARSAADPTGAGRPRK